MAHEVLGHCPVCGGETIVNELGCKKCDTIVRSKFELCKFCKLTPQQKYFIEMFIKNRGNIKEIEKELGISYPTVRNKLDEVIESLGYVVDNKNSVNRKEILDKLARGDITKEQALNLLS